MYFGVSDESKSPQYAQTVALITTNPKITGIIIFHIPLAPSFRISIVDMKIPNISTPLKAVSGPPFPYEIISALVSLVNPRVKQPSPPVT